MNRIPFREHHLFFLLEAYEAQTLPLDLFIHHYFREHKALGSKDRAFIAEIAYKLTRWQKLIDYLCKGESWKEIFEEYLKLDFDELQKNEEIPIDVRVSCPDELFTLLTDHYGLEQATKICLTNNKPAPTVIRVNTSKISRDHLFGKWKRLYGISPTKHSPDGIIFHKKVNFFELQEFKDGFFEVQDEGSQMVAKLVKPTPGQQVLDYCAGSGGKTLAFAPQMQGKGQIHLHDIRTRVLLEARKRLKRAGIQNNQIHAPDSPQLEKLKKKMDWVLVDAPCSGTGTYRRNPDMKWKFSQEMLTRLVGQQRTIFEKGLSFLRPDGRIVYATCSILKEENEKQVEHFIKTYSLEIEGEPFSSLPAPGEMDGFFGVVLKKK